MEMKFFVFSGSCNIEKFEINGIKADRDDFGYMTDLDPKNAEPWCCGNRKFMPDDNPKLEVLKKYNVSRKEWNEICKVLDEELSVGKCSFCS